jgi:membrane-associated protease RseP (regulator of RpoE activity)
MQLAESLAWIFGLIIFLVILVISIGLHEAGHMVVAKAVKLHVPKFFVGFGPTIFSRKHKNTEYGVKAVPLGGFVLIEDDKTPKPDTSVYDDILAQSNIDDETREKTEKERQKLLDDYEARKNLLSHVSPWKRILVFMAGPVVNLILGAAILITILMAFPSNFISNQIDTVNSCEQIKAGESCGAQQGGLQPGDNIVSINGTPVENSRQIGPLLANQNQVSVVVERNGSQQTFTVPVTNGKIGINLASVERTATFGESVEAVKNLFVLNTESLAKLPSKIPGLVNNILGTTERDAEAPSSIVAVGKTYGDTTASTRLTDGNKFKMMLMYSGLLNIGLGFINLFLPLMPLDGGRIFMALLDSVKMGFSKLTRRVYRPIGPRGMGAMSIITGVPVLIFMSLIIISDLANIFRGVL